MGHGGIWRGDRLKESLIARNGLQDTQIATRFGYPGHVVQADVRIGFLCEPLDEQELIEVQQWVGEYQLPRGPTRLEVHGAPCLFRRIGGQRSEVAIGVIDVGQVGSDIHANLSEVGRQLAAAFQACGRRVVRTLMDLRRRPLA